MLRIAKYVSTVVHSLPKKKIFLRWIFIFFVYFLICIYEPKPIPIKAHGDRIQPWKDSAVSNIDFCWITPIL